MSVEALNHSNQHFEGTPKINKNAAKTFDVLLEQKRAREVNKNDYDKTQDFLSYELSQMESHLGERFNVNISKFEYDIRGDKLYGQGMGEPFIDSIKRGVERRREIGNSIDQAREEAEVVGFSKIQSLLLDPETPVGTMMLSISPQGGDESTYQHNFYDIFTLKEKGSLKYIEARRYTSGLNVEDYKDKLSAFTKIEVDEMDPAASFLANPIAIEGALMPDDLHKYLHREHKTTDELTFEIVKKHCRSIAKLFSNSLIESPNNFELHKKLFNAYLNKADDIYESMKREGLKTWQEIVPISTSFMLNQEVEKYGTKEVKQVMTGCGLSSGYETSSSRTMSPMSVSEFGKSWDYHKGDCVSCKRRYTQVGPCSICKDCEKEFDEEAA